MDSIHDWDSAYRQQCAPIDKVTKRHRARNIASDTINIAKTQTKQEEYWHFSSMFLSMSRDAHTFNIKDYYSRSNSLSID